MPEEEDLCTVKIVGSHHHADFAVAYLKRKIKKQSVVQFYEYIVAYFKDYKKKLIVFIEKQVVSFCLLKYYHYSMKSKGEMKRWVNYIDRC